MLVWTIIQLDPLKLTYDKCYSYDALYEHYSIDSLQYGEGNLYKAAVLVF